MVRKVFAKGDSARARNLFFTPYLDFEAKVFRHNRPINPHKPIRIHFHSNKNILTDSRRVGQCTRFSNPTFRIIGVLTYFLNIKNGKKQFFNTQFSLLNQNKGSKLVTNFIRDSMRTDRGSEEDNFHVTTLQIWQISDFGWAFAYTISSREHSTKLAIGLEMCNSK